MCCMQVSIIIIIVACFEGTKWYGGAILSVVRALIHLFTTTHTNTHTHTASTAVLCQYAPSSSHENHCMPARGEVKFIIKMHTNISPAVYGMASSVRDLEMCGCADIWHYSCHYRYW